MEHDDSAGAAPKHPQQLFFDNVSPATRLLEKRRQMYEVQDALETQKKRFDRQEIEFREEEKRLRKKDLHLQHQLFRFNKFLQDNEAKRRRAETRAAEEAQQINLKELEIKDLERQLEESRRYCNELEAQVAKNKKYEEFLEKVKDAVQQYAELPDLLKRYDTLENANVDLMQESTASEKKVEELRAEYQKYMKEQEMQALSQTTHIAALQAELYEASKARQALEKQLDDATYENSQHSLEFGEILFSVENLYERCINTRGGILQHKNTHMDDEGATAGAKGGEAEETGEVSFRTKQQYAIKQLRVIHDYLVDFKDMVDTLRSLRKERRAAQAMQAKHAAGMMEQFIEPKVEFVEVGAKPAGGFGSQTSSSQNATKDITRSTRDSS